ncbi:MAG: glycosyltransferase [uncultured archaeon A07HB70]|nr:MAG: glycosyltransferase [uncultured archaeon A07HB70]
MSEREPTSVLLPTLEWGPVAAQLAAGLRAEDELLLVCDSADDPVASHDTPAGARVLVAGDPDGCSGKANALARGMEAARHDRLVWTDDDFERGPDWLDELVAAGVCHGPASAVPFFTGSGWWRLVEPWYGALFALLVTLQVGPVADTAWGGGVTFTREELTTDVESLAAELRTVLSDDYLLTQRLPSVHPVRSMVTPVEVAGDAGAVVSRIVRFGRIVGVNEGWRGSLVNLVVAAVGLAYPFVVAPLLTAVFVPVYLCVGERRVNALFAYPGLLLLPVTVLGARLVTEFEWAGRRYRFPESGVVEVVREREG